ncbi:TetR/AcrR family transcriptional regulator [Eggerthellaceae bacterium zg-997]|nr:TetR/AcrR family transcriptional regulator [Eggerthellaceae bacterium zg-997]
MKPVRSAKSQRTRQNLLSAALRVIGREGYTAATVDQIVREAGVSKGVAYYHFKSKEEIGASILAEKTDQIHDRLAVCAEEGRAPDETLHLMLTTFTELAFHDLVFTRFLMNELWREGRIWSDDLRRKMGLISTLIAEQIERGQRSGLFRPQLDARFLATGMIGLVITNAMRVADPEAEHPMSEDAFCAQVALLFRQALLTEDRASEGTSPTPPSSRLAR